MSGLARNTSNSTLPNSIAWEIFLGGFGCCNIDSLRPKVSSSSGESIFMAQQVRSTVPNRFTATGLGLPLTFSNSRAGPPAASIRLAISAISRLGSTGTVIRRS